MESKSSNLSIGIKLRKLRNSKGYTQDYMAEKLKVSQKTYSNMENEKATISLETLKKIAEELDTDLIELISDSKVVIQYNTTNDTSTAFNGVVNNAISEDLIIQFKERIEDLKNQLKTKDDLIELLKNNFSNL